MLNRYWPPTGKHQPSGTNGTGAPMHIVTGGGGGGGGAGTTQAFAPGSPTRPPSHAQLTPGLMIVTIAMGPTINEIKTTTQTPKRRRIPFILSLLNRTPTPVEVQTTPR